MSKKTGILLMLSILITGCSRDEQFVPTNGITNLNPTIQAPQPSVPNIPPGGGVTNPTFQPQLPTGYSYYYTAFLPIDYYMRAYGYQAYWQQLWSQWQSYAWQVQTTQYDFNTFWFEFCPQVWSGSQLWSLYQYVDQVYYYWVQPYTVIQPTTNPSYFWYYYTGYGYGGNQCTICW